MKSTDFFQAGFKADFDVFETRLKMDVDSRKEDIRHAKRIMFLSVEGDVTEQNYFEHLQRHIDMQSDDVIIHIEVLKRQRGTGLSDPKQVIDLMDEYIELRRNCELIESIEVEGISRKDIETLLKKGERISEEKEEKVNEWLLENGIDLHSYLYVSKYKSENDSFSVVIDRDQGNHSLELMEWCLEYCCEKGYACYISNPCFEFWLLLHLCDVKERYGMCLDNLLNNEKISVQHTYVSKEVSNLAYHKKHISSAKFDEVYWPNINLAIDRAKSFATDSSELLDRLGTNVGELVMGVGFMPKESG